MIYGQGHLIPQSLSTLLTFGSDLQNLTDFGENFLLLLPAGMLLEPALSKVRRHPSKVSKPHPTSLFHKHRDKDRSQQGWMGRNAGGRVAKLSVGKRQGKNRWPLTAQSSLLFTSQRPSWRWHPDTRFLLWSQHHQSEQPYGTPFTAKCCCPFHFQLPLEMFNVALQNDW